MTIRLLTRLSTLPFERRPDSLARLADGFTFADDWQRQRTVEVVRSFAVGYNAALRSGDPHEVRTVADGVPRYFRPFCYEGAAMGFGPWAWLRGRRVHAAEAVFGAVNPGTVYQNYVGFGWWLAMISAGRPRAMRNVCDRLDPRYRLLPYEGLGFRAGFRSAGDPAVTACFARHGTAAEHVAYQGFGRSLWFVNMGGLAAAVRTVDAFDPRFHGDCYSGLGLGFAFSWLDRTERLPEVAGVIPAGSHPDFLQGTAFGWEARQLADRELFDAELADTDLAARVNASVAAVHEVRDELVGRGQWQDFYQHWRFGTRRRLTKADLGQAPTVR